MIIECFKSNDEAFERLRQLFKSNQPSSLLLLLPGTVTSSPRCSVAA
jgi:hypothetical protein